MKKISIIIPYYNSEKTIDRCLLSIPCDENIEIIIVDDGSDRLVSLNNDLQNDKRIKIIAAGHNGVSAARNTGVKNATGEYIHFVDSDDELLPRIKEVYQSATTEDIIIFGAEIKLLSEQFRHKDVCPRQEMLYDEPRKALFYEDSCRPYVWNSLYKRSFVLENNLLFDKDLVIGEDLKFQMEAFIAAKTCRFLPIVGYMYYFGAPNSTIYYYLNHPYERVVKHLELLKSINIALIKRNVRKLQGYCNWMVSFIYEDFLSLDLKQQNSLDDLCRDTFKECGRVGKMTWKDRRHILVMENKILKTIRKGIKK